MDTEKFKKSFIRFFSNPNTLTFIFAIIAIIVLYKVYSYMVDNAIRPTTLYYANTDLYEGDLISPERTDSSFLSSNNFF